MKAPSPPLCVYGANLKTQRRRELRRTVHGVNLSALCVSVWKSARLRFCFICVALCLASLSPSASAQITNEMPPLQPPYPELPPSLWEQYGLWLLGLGGLLATLVGFVVWRWLSPKPPVLVPIEIQTRQQLETLRRQNEDGRILSQVSRCLRRYVTIAFQLPTEELTTSEFCRAMTAQSAIDPDLARVLCDFLRRCDELKFAPAGNSPPFGAAEQALKLFEAGERRRAELQRIASSHAENPPQKPS